MNRPVMGRAAALLLFAMAASAALARGGVSLRAEALACALSALCLGLAALPDRRGRSPRLPLFTLVPLLVFAAGALQCLPIPSLLLRLLAPANAAIRFLPPAPAQSFAPMTLDLPATAAQLAPAFALLAALAAAALLGRRERTQLLLMCAPIAAALVQVGICFVRLAGQGSMSGTFVNRNHLAGLLILGALCAMGAALSPPREEEPGTLPQLATTRPLWIASASASAAAALMTLSRGAAVSLFIGALALLWLERRALARAPRGPSTPRTRQQRFRMLWVALPLAGGVVAALLLSTTPLTSRFVDLSHERMGGDLKLRSFIGAAEVALEHPLFGVGRGAWRYLAERHRSVPGELAFIYVEDEPLQLAAEEGIPLALLVLAISLLAWRRAARAASSGLARGVLAGALAVALQNLVDFNLEFIGVGLPLAVAFGAALADERGRPVPWSQTGPRGAEPVPGADGVSEAPKSTRSRETPGWRRVPRPLLYTAAFLGLLLAPLPLLLARFSAERESARLVFEARDPATRADQLLRDADETVVRHPADWLVSLAPAIGLHQRTPRRTAEALAWTGRAQALGPLASRPHIVAAAILLRAGRPAQARVETRLAMENLGELDPGEAAALASRASETLDELLEASPDDAWCRARLAFVLRVEHRTALARQLVEHELARDPQGRPPEQTTRLQLELAIALADAKEFAAAEQIALQLPATSCDRALLVAQARRAQAKSDAEIEQPLLDALPDCPRTLQLYDLLFHGRLARLELAGAASILDDPQLSDTTLPFADLVHIWRAELLDAKAEPAKAMHERWLSALGVPDNPDRALDYARRLSAQGDVPGALVALRTLAMRAGPDARAPIDAKITELEKQRELQRAQAEHPQAP